ncbi:major facilitator superfamily domain-containing protein [Podospora aff. communis PSN243]|uniref:Major facilitator superfamily domain-containing protein n=1 Tax=Podospora aff. communis PSN243 TaxID=3040156 RepID=A0AAV9GXE9_9PEZI|nr:major facilitator superfamily domain-containing protein [Podospora aff. communis PSN243]
MGRPHLPAAIRDFVLGPKRGATTLPSPPPFLAFRSSTLFITSTVCLAIFTDIFLYGLIVPVIPFSLSAQAGVPEEEVQQWTAILLACYNATLCVGSPIAGYFADHTASRRLPLLLGLLALAGSTLLLCLGTTVALLVVGRLLQGFSAAVVWSVGLALLVDTVGKDVGQSMGYVSIAMSVGLLISPVIGGAVYAAAGYYAVYYIAFALIICDIALRFVLIEKKVARQWLDTAADDHRAPGRASTDNLHNGDLAAGTAPSDEKTRRPLLELVRTKRIIAVLLGVVLEAVLVFACDTVLPLFVKDVFQWDSTAAGLVFICIMLPGFASPLVGALADRYGAKWPAVAGFTLSIPLVACLRFVTLNTLGHKVFFCAMLALLGATLLTLVNTVLMAATTYAIDDKEARRPGVWGEKGVYGMAYGLWTTCYALGGTIGSLIAGYVNSGPGWSTLTWSLAIFCAAGAVVSFGLGPAPTKQNVGSGTTNIDAMDDSCTVAP